MLRRVCELSLIANAVGVSHARSETPISTELYKNVHRNAAKRILGSEVEDTSASRAQTLATRPPQSIGRPLVIEDKR